MDGETDGKKKRLVSGRMITDIEMNGTVRGAVEVYNLARNIRPNDCLFAECIRTFATVDVDARAWLHRLEVELQNLREVAFVTYVPPSVRPHVRSNNCKPEYADMYGFTPKLKQMIMWNVLASGELGLPSPSLPSSLFHPPFGFSSAFSVHVLLVGVHVF